MEDFDGKHSRVNQETRDGGKSREISFKEILSEIRKEDAHHKSGSATKPKTNDDLQRAIEGLKDIPDEELQEFLDDEDFMEGLDVVDAWEGEEDKRGDTRFANRANERDRRRISRDRYRNRDHRSPNYRERVRRDDRRKEENRRDPSKSSKDIERDKIRTKKDSESKILAEKEKAIKYILDSDDVVPPGTEADAIRTIAEKNDIDKLARTRIRRSRERRRSTDRRRGSPIRRRSAEKVRRSPHRRWSPVVLSPDRRRNSIRLSPSGRRSPLKLSPSHHRSSLKKSASPRRSPLILSPERRRSPLRLSPNHPRRLSWEHRTSIERRRSSERRRRRVLERELRHLGRRSRSPERHRSRSNERHRKRLSRSPVDRRSSPRWRSRSGSRGKSPHKRPRKRSPFINEITRQFRSKGLLPLPTPGNPGFMGQPGIQNLPTSMGPPGYQPDQEPHRPFMPHHQPGPQGIPGGPPGFVNFEAIHPHGAPMHFNPNNQQPLLQSEFASGPVMYNQPNAAPVRPVILPQPVPSPQPVPAPGSLEQRTSAYNQQQRGPPFQPAQSQHLIDLIDRRSTTPHGQVARSITPGTYVIEPSSISPYNGQRSSNQDRLKTPEPPVISDSKATFRKTSLSSLLEASVSAKDSTGPPVLYPGFKPEILRHCEHALRDLPTEDPRLKMKGRFFFNPKKEDPNLENEERSSNSILLRKGRNKIYWDEEEERHSQATMKPGIQTHQKICQTDEVQTDFKCIQATVTMVDIGVQVYPYDLKQPPKEEPRTIMDRLDWPSRETFDYAPKPREADDLRWSLSNSSQKRPWARNSSPVRGPDNRVVSGDTILTNEYAGRNVNHGSPTRIRPEFQPHRGPILRDHFVRDSFASDYRQDIEERPDRFLDDRSDRSRGESPMVLEDSPDELDDEPQVFTRAPERHILNKIPRGKMIPDFKPRGGPRGGRPFRGRGSFRGKF